MKIKSIVLTSVSIIAIILLTGCSKKKEETLVSSSNSVVATCNDFKEMINILEKNESGLQFIPLLPAEEQEKIYLKLVEEYIVSNFLIKKYLEENKISSTDKFKDEYKSYMKVMENNYNSTSFQKAINDSISITDEISENYYLNNRESIAEFLVAPFTKKSPGFEARAVRIEDGTSFNEYKDRLKNNKDVIYLERINSAMRGTSQILIDNLKSMKNNEMREIKIENGMNFAIMKINEHKGEWASYSEVSDKVKNILRSKMLQQKYEEAISDLKEKYKVEINNECIKNYVKNAPKKDDPSEEELEKAVNDISETIAEEQAMEIASDMKDDLKNEIIEEIAEVAVENSEEA